MSVKVYQNDTDFYKDLEVMHPTFDIEKTLRLGKWHFSTKDGEVHTHYSSDEMFCKMNEVFGDFLDLKRSIARPSMYVITYLDTDSPQEEVQTFVKEVKITDKVDEGIAFNLEYAENLYDENSKSESKNKLEEYGVQFGIDLKKNQNFHAMLDDLVKHCEE